MRVSSEVRDMKLSLLDATLNTQGDKDDLEVLVLTQVGGTHLRLGKSSRLLDLVMSRCRGFGAFRRFLDVD